MEVALSGYHVPSLSTSIDYGIEERAQTLAAESGLGAATPSQEQDIVRAYLSSARARFRDMGLRFTALRRLVWASSDESDATSGARRCA